MVHCVHSRRPGKMAHHTQQCSNGNNSYDIYHGDGSSAHQRDPPPYPGHFRQYYNPGYRQSYSGSETSTDISLSSSENLSLAVRQDPQGEENTQALSNPLDGIDSDSNYSILSRLGMSLNPTNDVEVKSTNPGTFYVTGSPSRSSSTSPPQSDISDISSILQFIASTGAPSYTAVSPTGSCSSSGGSSIYSMASHYLQHNAAASQQQMPYQQLQQQQQQQQPPLHVKQEPPKKLQRPKSANVPLTKDVVRDLQQQASRFLEEQCQQYIQAQNQEQCIQQQMQQQQQMQEQQQQHQLQHQQQLQHHLQQQQQLFSGSQNQEPFLPAHLFRSQFQQQPQQHVVTQDDLQSLQDSKKTNFPFSTNQGQQVSQASQVQQQFASLPPYITSQLMTSNLEASRQSAQLESSSKPPSPTYAYVPPPFPLPPQGFSLNPVGKPRHGYRRQNSSGSQKSGHKLQVGTSTIPLALNELHVKPINEGHSPQQTIIKQQQVLQDTCRTDDHEEEYPAPPQYPGVVANQITVSKEAGQRELRRSFEMLGRLQSGLTRSQPDLTKLLDENTPKPLALSKTDLDLPRTCSEIGEHLNKNLHKNGKEITQPPPPAVLCNFSSKPKPDLNHAVIATRATEMVERLSHENNSLRRELEGYYGKLSKLQKLEMEIKKISDAYDGLVKHSHKRENLEKMMRFKLDNEMKKFKHVNKELKDQLDRALSQLQKKDIYNVGDSDLRREITKKDSMIAKLLSQNKEMTSAKERLDIESTAQRSTLQEQRTHIEILDKALNNAQSSIVRMEEELRKKAIQDEKIEQLQRAVSQLQLVAAKREAVEHRHRSKLEEEIRSLKEHHNLSISKNSDTDEGIASDCESSTGHHQGLLQQLRDKDNRILALESEVLKFEQRYLEESALRHLAVDAVSMPKDMRIAALEKSSVETEKVIAQSRSERLKHLEEVYQANRRSAELEAQVKSQAAQLAERDAMINVLQKHSTLGSRTSSVASLLSSSPLHSPIPTLSSPIPSPLSSLITSTVASIMSLSQSLPSSGTTSPSRQGSVISDSPIFKEVKTAPHIKSGSVGSSMSSNTSVGPSTEALRDLQQRIAEQAALLHSMQSGGDQLSKILWQV